MSEHQAALYAIYIEGETKTGKGAASDAIANTLRQEGISVHYAVAGDFFRRFTAIIRRELSLSPDDPLPQKNELTILATELYENRKAFQVDAALGDLQRPEISNCVSQLGELPIAQKAAVAWYEETVHQALASGAQALVMDGRNPRSHIEQSLTQVTTLLDIYMTCSPDIAARRILASNGIDTPSADLIASEAENVSDRRRRDRERAEWPFVWPSEFLVIGDNAQGFVDRSWQAAVNPPLPLVIDNSKLDLPAMTSLVSALTLDSISIMKRV